ncbi:MAG: class I SAM-dependent methyltransferase [Thermoleophilaceae bacterium]
MDPTIAANEEAVGAWNGVLFDRFVAYRDIIVTGLEQFGEQGLRLCPPRAGDRALDIGCGFGDTTQRIGELVGPEGSAVGIDAAPRFIDTASEEAAAAGADNVSFLVGDIQAAELPGPFDYAFSRMGTMFVANPVVALRNVRAAMNPGARLCICVWRRKLENVWLYEAEQAVEEWLEEDPESDELTCGPGPFAQANADTVSGQLLAAGFGDVALHRVDIDMLVGRDIDHAVSFVCALGPAGEAIRLAGEQAETVRPQVESAVRAVLEPYARDDGAVLCPATSWVVTGSNAA